MLTNKSIRPNRSTTARANRSVSSWLVTSVGTAIASAPSSETAPTASSSSDFASRGQRQLRPLPRIGQRNRPPDAAARARNYRNPTIQFHSHNLATCPNQALMHTQVVIRTYALEPVISSARRQSRRRKFVADI